MPLKTKKPKETKQDNIVTSFQVVAIFFIYHQYIYVCVCYKCVCAYDQK